MKISTFVFLLKQVGVVRICTSRGSQANLLLLQGFRFLVNAVGFQSQRFRVRFKNVMSLLLCPDLSSVLFSPVWAVSGQMTRAGRVLGTLTKPILHTICAVIGIGYAFYLTEIVRGSIVFCAH